MSQTETDESKRDEIKVLLKDVISIVKENFDQKMKQLEGRSSQDQTIIGNTLTTLEIELKKDIKNLANGKYSA